MKNNECISIFYNAYNNGSISSHQKQSSNRMCSIELLMIPLLIKAYLEYRYSHSQCFHWHQCVRCAYQPSICLKSVYAYSKGITLYWQITLSRYCIVQCDCEIYHCLWIKWYKRTTTTTIKHCLCCLKPSSSTVKAAIFIF